MENFGHIFYTETRVQGTTTKHADLMLLPNLKRS